MGRALMIPGMVGKNIAEWMSKNDLPKTVSEYGAKVEEIFVNYEAVKSMLGNGNAGKVPLGAIGIFSYVDKLKVGLQQIMAGARRFSVNSIARKDLMSLTDECSRVTRIPYVMDAYRAEAEAILKGYALNGRSESHPKLAVAGSKR
jgi:hypothetical protein